MTLAITAPNWIKEQRERLAEVEARLADEQLNAIIADTKLMQHISECLEQISPVLTEIPGFLLSEDGSADRQRESVELCWVVVCRWILALPQLRSRILKIISRIPDPTVRSMSEREYFRDGHDPFLDLLNYYTDVARTVLVSKPEWDLPIPNDIQDLILTIRIPPHAYLRAMWNLFWSAIRHPFSDTTIDLSTGHVLYRT